MESDKSISAPVDGHSEFIQRIRPLHGRTSGPTRRSTKGQWTAEEDEILRKAVQRFKGKNWKKIAECFKDRTDVQCLHRWQKVLNPELVKGPWSKEEDEIIVELVNKYGPKKWSTVAQHLPGRIGKQCRERWHNHLNPSINKEAWTQQEELILIRAHQVYGNRWAELTKFLPGRTDNAIKNHWNSSVKKKLDSYSASGLLEQFQGLPLVPHQSQSLPSSSSRVQSSGDMGPRFVNESEEISECSQGSTVAGCSQSGNAVLHITEEFHLHEDSGLRKEQSSSPVSCSDQYFTSIGDAGFPIPKVPLEVGCPSNFIIPQNLTHNTMTHQVGLDDPASLQCTTVNPKPDSVLVSEDECCRFLFSDELNGVIFSSENFDNEPNSTPYMDTISNAQLSELSKISHSISPSKYGGEQDFVPSAHDGLIYTNCTTSSLCDGGLDNSVMQEDHPKDPSKLVPVDSFVSNTDATHSGSINEIPTTEVKLEDTGSLCYEPPRFPSLDIPFLSCDLVQSGSDIQQEYSPLGIRQLMMSSVNCLSPFRLWDSPTRDSSSSDAVLKSAAKAFNGTPSVLKKRSRDLLSPLSDRRIDKKLQVDLASSLSKEFSKLDAVLGDSMISPSYNEKRDNLSSIEDKENLDPSLEGGEQNGKVEQPSGELIEDIMSDILFFSPDQVGFKADKALAPSSRTPKNLYRVILGTLSEKAAALETASGNVSSPTYGKKSCENQSVATTSGISAASSAPLDVSVNDNRIDEKAETHSLFGVTPFRRSIESPSAWKSPWFMNSIEDIGFFLSPGDRSYDAIALMKELTEQNASTYADALDVLGNETPKTLLEKRRSIVDQDNNNNNVANVGLQENDSGLASNILTDCRTLDFSECETPGKKATERAKCSTAVPSPSSYLLKSCR